MDASLTGHRRLVLSVLDSTVTCLVPWKFRRLFFCCICILLCFRADFLSPTSTPFLPSILAHPVSLSEWNSCFLDPQGSVHCWSAHSTRRQLDNVTQNEAWLNQNPPEEIRQANFTSIRGGRAHTCGVIYPSSRLVCWGSNLYGQLQIHPNIANQPVQAFDMGDDFTCAQLSNSATQPGLAGGWFCWGRMPSSLTDWPAPFNDQKGLWTGVVAGIGPWLCTLQQQQVEERNQTANTTSILMYVIPHCIGDNPPFLPADERIQVDETTKLLDWAAGSDFFCVLLSNHSQKCYGSNEWGALNLADTQSGAGKCQLLTAAIGALCCLLDGGSILCEGRSLEGQTSAPQIGIFTNIVCRYYSCCSVTSMGFAQCWGDQGDLASQFSSPVYIDLGAGVNQMLAQLPSGRLIGWGDNSDYQLNIPEGVTDWISFSTSNDKSCGVRALNNTILCWGNWNPPSSDSFIPPPRGDAATGWRLIAVGLQHACGILVNGRLQCFGSNSSGQTNVPEEAVTALGPMKNCDASMFHTCCIGTNGASPAVRWNSSAVFNVSANAVCFGLNHAGQLQIPWIPYEPTLNLTWSRIAVGTSHSVGLLSNGSMRAWGNNNEGQCSVPTQSDIATNPQLQDLELIDRNTTTGELLYSDPHAGAYHSCGILMSRRAVCFGYNLSGQAGNPYPSTRFKQLNLAGAFTAGIDMANHTLLLWGANNKGQLQQPIVEVLAAPVGFYLTIQGERNRCSSTTYSLGMGAIGLHCSGVCAEGKYGSVSAEANWRNSSCAGPCPIGHKCPAGTATPYPCNKSNEWQPDSGQGSCAICTVPGGTFGAYVDANRTQCGWYDCPGGTAPSPNGCSICPAGQFAQGGPDPCRNCSAGTYNFLPGAESCVLCTGEEGLDCSSPQAQVRRGFWAYRVPTNVTNDHGKLVLVGILKLSPCAPNLCDGEPDSLNLTNPCSPNRSRDPDNILCGRCDKGFSYWNELCVECPGVNYGMIFLIALSSFLLVGLLHVLMNSSRRRTRAASVSITLANDHQESVNEYESESASAVDVALNFGQASWIQFYRSVGFQTFLAFLSFDQRGTTGSTCLAPLSAVANLASPAVVPFILFAELAMIACGQACAVHLVTRQTVRSRQPTVKRNSDDRTSIRLPKSSDAATLADDTPASESTSSSGSEYVSSSSNVCLIWLTEHCQKVKWHNYISTSIMLLTFSFQQTVRVCLRYLNCFSVADALVVYTAPAIDCHSSEYHQWKPLVIVILIMEFSFFAALVAVVLVKYSRERTALRAAVVQVQVQPQIKRASSKLPKPDSLTASSLPASSMPRKSIYNSSATGSAPGLPGKSASFSSSSANLSHVLSLAVLPASPVQDVADSSQPVDSTISNSNSSISMMTIEARFRVLFAPYSSHAYYWCVWDMFRRTALILIDTFLLDHPSRSLALVYFNMLCLVVQLIVRPYVSTITNRLEVMALSILVVLSVATLSSPTTSTPTAIELLVVIGVVSGLVIMIFFVLVLYSHQWEELKPQLIAPVISLHATLRSMIFGEQALTDNLKKRVQTDDVVLEMQPPADVRQRDFAIAEDDSNTHNQQLTTLVVESDTGNGIAASIDDYGCHPMTSGRLSDTIETLGSNREQQFLSSTLLAPDGTSFQPRPSVSDPRQLTHSSTLGAGAKKVHLPTFNDDALMAAHPSALRFSDAAERNDLFKESGSVEASAPRSEDEKATAGAAGSSGFRDPAPRRSMPISELLPASQTESDPILHEALRDHGLLLDSETDQTQNPESTNNQP